MTTTHALILFAHGARDPRWAAPFEAVAAHIRAARADLTVQLAFLDFMTPDLPGAAAACVGGGATQVDIVPMFLGAGGHVRQDLPPMIEALRAAHPGTRFLLHPAIGEIDAVTRAMAEAIAVTAAPAAPGPIAPGVAVGASTP
jgi:sirohydrochlorin cobaltochelatase